MVDVMRVPERVPLTPAGRQHIEEEIVRLEEQLVELRGLISDAHDDRGADDDERAALVGLLDDYGRLEARLHELRATLASAVDAAPSAADVADIGTVVFIRDTEGEEDSYTLVTPAEAAPSAGRLSILSPLGRALLGHRPGETATVEAPSGSWEIEIVSIRPAA